MPYKDKEKKRQYDRERIQKRRAKWFLEEGPCRKCGSAENLEVDHIDPSTKVSHRIWSWSEERLYEELAKCQPLCKNCHKNKTSDQISVKEHGTTMYQRGCRCRVCTDAKVKEVNEWRWKTGRRRKS